jgi:hypothetical protein
MLPENKDVLVRGSDVLTASLASLCGACRGILESGFVT